MGRRGYGGGRRYGYRSGSYRSTAYDPGKEAARRHVQEAEEFTREIGGTDTDVKAYFFSLPPRELSAVLAEYGRLYGAQAEDYAHQTFADWKDGTRRMSGMVAKRLFSLLPKRMPLALKYELAGNIWRHFGPSSSHAFVVGVDTPTELVASRIAETLDNSVSAYSIPQNVSARFDWLADGDVKVKEQLLNYFRMQEKALAVEKLKNEIPVLQRQVREHGKVTSLARTVLEVHKHRVSIRVQKGDFSGIEVDRNPSGASNDEPSAILRYWWLWGLLALALIWFFNR